MSIKYEDVSTPVTKEEFESRLLGGWYIFGQVNIKDDSGLSTPSNPDGRVKVTPCNIWVHGPSLLPAGMVAQVLLKSESKDELCEVLFEKTLEELEKALDV